MQDLRPAVYTARLASLAAPSFAALSYRSWFKNMWRRFEQNAICRPKNEKQFQVACLEGQPHDRGTQIRPALGKHYFLHGELKLDQLDQFSFAPPIPGQKVH